jgi:hypothetical protein
VAVAACAATLCDGGTPGACSQDPGLHVASTWQMTHSATKANSLCNCHHSTPCRWPCAATDSSALSHLLTQGPPDQRLALPLLVLLAQQRHMASLASGSAQLKFVTEYYDRCHETCLQYLQHLQSMDLQAYARWGCEQVLLPRLGLPCLELLICRAPTCVCWAPPWLWCASAASCSWCGMCTSCAGRRQHSNINGACTAALRAAACTAACLMRCHC